MKVRKPTDQEHVWIGSLADRSTNSMSLVMIVDGKKIAVWLTRPIGGDVFGQDDLLDKAAAALMHAVQ